MVVGRAGRGRGHELPQAKYIDFANDHIRKQQREKQADRHLHRSVPAPRQNYQYVR